MIRSIKKHLRDRCHSLFLKNAVYGGYIDAAETVDAAERHRLSVCEYVELLWDQQGATDQVIEEMHKAGCLTQCRYVCEIGPGTGRYLERLIKHIPNIRRYDIYETANDWAEWLEKKYSPYVFRQPADGQSLSQTHNSSCNLVHAHGVFVYLPLLCAFQYFTDMSRVCADGGYVVFDFYPDEEFNVTMIRHWLASADRYPVVLPYKAVIDYFNELGFSLVHNFENKYGHGHSRYVVFEKKVDGTTCLSSQL